MNYDVLFIGGKADGRRMKVESLLPFFRVAVTEYGADYEGCDFSRAYSLTCEYEEYKLRIFAPDWPIYTPAGMKQDEILARLMENYRPRK